MRFIISFSICLFGLTAYAQNSIKGTVEDTNGKPLQGANIFLGNKGVATTDGQGRFVINEVSSGKHLLVITFLGYKDYSEQLEVAGDVSLTVKLEEDLYYFDGITVEATRFRENSPAVFTSISKTELSKKNLGQDFPYLIDNTPGVVSFSDAGAGIGYSGLRIRGSDPGRINVTINGIPLNDSESQVVFWVDLPDFATSIESVQVQRGVGTSTNGSGAFGASINIETELPSSEPTVQLSNSIGSFNTRKHTLVLGTGLIDDKLNFNVRLSEIASDGYIDRASSKLRSAFFTGMYKGDKSLLKLNVFTGKEITYQAWDGVSESDLASNRTFNVSGQIGPGEFYDNQVDDYTQNHYQLHYNYFPKNNLELGLSFHYTRGFGFFEQYRVDDNLAEYGLADITVGNTIITSTDLVRRRWLDNDFYGTTFSALYSPKPNLKLTFGGSINNYLGDHFGEIIWAQYASSNNTDRYYFNTGEKFESNYYLKGEFSVTPKLLLFGDLQLRNLNYEVNGIDNDQRTLRTSKGYTFINPKVGISFLWHPNVLTYFNYSNGSKEPVRTDFIDAPDGQIPKDETLHDFEAGLRWSKNNLNAELNLYYMNYRDQLVLTGELNDVGSPIRRNVDESFRSGAELSISAAISPKFKFDANFSYSINKIKEFTEMAPVFDFAFNYLRDSLITYRDTDIILSPNIVAYGRLTYEPIEKLQLAFEGKFVGKQYLDNKSNNDRRLDEFLVNNFNLSYNYPLEKTWIKGIGFNFLINNIFDVKYEPNGYSYFILFDDGSNVSQENYNFYYPQAGINFLAGLEFSF